MRRAAGTALVLATLSAGVAALVRAAVPRTGTMHRLSGGRGARIVDTGPADAPSVVLIHGLGGQAENFARLTPLLAGRRTLCIERAGAGRSDPAAPGGASLPAQAARIAAVIEAEGAAPAVIVGHSLGGAVALQLAADRPDLVRGLVLIGALSRAHLPGLAGFGAGLGRMAPLREALARSLLAPALLVLAPGLARLTFAPEAIPSGFARWGGGMLLAQPRALSGVLRDLDVVARGIGALQPRLGAIAAPTVVLHGACDQVVPLAQARHAARALPRARLAITSGAGHMLPVTRPEVCAAAILSL